MTRLLAQVLEAAGITREELHELVRARQEELIAETQRQLDADLLRLGREFRQERREPPRVVTKPKPEPAADGGEVEPSSCMQIACKELPPLIETEHCAAYLCTNAPHTTVVRVFNGRALRVRYCRPHADEVQLEKVATAGVNGRSS